MFELPVVTRVQIVIRNLFIALPSAPDRWESFADGLSPAHFLVWLATEICTDETQQAAAESFLKHRYRCHARMIRVFRALVAHRRRQIESALPVRPAK